MKYIPIHQVSLTLTFTFRCLVLQPLIKGLVKKKKKKKLQTLNSKTIPQSTQIHSKNNVYGHIMPNAVSGSDQTVLEILKPPESYTNLIPKVSRLKTFRSFRSLDYEPQHTRPVPVKTLFKLCLTCTLKM